LLQALDLSPDLLAQREVVHVDIAFDGLSSGEKKPELVRRQFIELLDTDIQSRVHGGEGRACSKLSIFTVYYFVIPLQF